MKVILFLQWGCPGEQLSTLSGLYSFLRGMHFWWDGCCEAIISLSFFLSLYFQVGGQTCLSSTPAFLHSDRYEALEM